MSIKFISTLLLALLLTVASGAAMYRAMAAVSATLSVNVVPGAAVTTPAGASAAGFTTLAANFDFSDPLYATQSNWLAPWQGGNTNPAGTFTWFQTVTCDSVGPTPPPVGSMAQTFDSDAGKNVLKLSWLGSYYGHGASRGCSVDKYVQLQTEETNNGPRGQDFPQGMYIEALVRVDRNNTFATDAFNVVWAFWAYGSGHSGFNFNPNGPIERDYIEIFANPGGSPLQYANQTILNWGTGNPGAGSTQQSLTSINATLSSYHKIATRTTTNGTTMESCGYVDDVLLYCNNDHATAGQFSNQRNRVILQCGDTSNDMSCYIQYVRAWSCANWKTTQCNGTVLTGAP